MKNIYILLITALALSSCVKDIPIGHLSENIRMREDTLSAGKGVYVVSGVPMLDGSTRPLRFDIASITDLRTGEKATDLLQTYPVKLWRSPFNPDTDTTMALINEKLYTENMVPLTINHVSGQVALNAGTSFVPGDLYSVDVKVSNENSSKMFEKFAIVRLSYEPWGAMNNMGEYFYGMVNTDPTPQNNIDARPSVGVEEMLLVRANTHPRFHIKKVGESDEVYVKLTFLDSNDVPFHGNAIARWPSGASYSNNWFDNSIGTEILADGVLFKFPVTPFPAFGRTNTGGREAISLSYYVLRPGTYELTPAARAKSNTAAMEMGKVFTGHNLQVKVTYQINEPGQWEVTAKFAYAIKK